MNNYIKTSHGTLILGVFLFVFVNMITKVSNSINFSYLNLNQTATVSDFDSNLIGYYTFDGKDVVNGVALNKAGSSNNGNLISIATSTFYDQGKIGQGFRFDGADDYIDAGTDILGVSALTVSAWIYPNSYGEVSAGKIVNNGSSSFNIAGDFNRIRWTNNGINQGGSANDSVLLNRWTHVLITRTSAGVVNFYVNGVLSGTANQGTGVVGSLTAATENFSIGNRSLKDRTFDGIIDDVRVYSRVLTAQEINDVYSYDGTSVPVSQPPVVVVPTPDPTVVIPPVQIDTNIPVTNPEPVVSNIVSKNILENSNFEVGYGHGWGFDGAWGDTKFLTMSLIDNTQAFQGRSSVKMSFDGKPLLSKIYRLKSNQKHTLSFYVKGPSGYTVTAQMINSFALGYGPGDIHGPYSFKLLSNDWERFSFEFTTANNIDKSSYYIKISPLQLSDPNVNFWVDAIQLEEETISNYTQSNLIDNGIYINSNKTGNVFFEDESVFVNIKQFNISTTSQNIAVRYETFDYYNRLIKKGVINKTINPQSSSENTIDLTSYSNKRGAFRVVSWIEGVPNTLDEIIYSVIPHPQNIQAKDSIMGSHFPFIDYFLSLGQKMGIHWNRTLSPASTFRWGLVEQVKGNFIWKDSQVSKAAIYGMEILGVLDGSLPFDPSWTKDATGYPKISDWENYVYTVVSHYKNSVKYWEIWNEPDTEGGKNTLGPALTGVFYGQILKSGYQKIKLADPTSTTVGMVAFNTSFIIDAITAVGSSYMDKVSSHIYNNNEQGITRILDLYKIYNKDVWNTETGNISQTFYRSLIYDDLMIDYNRPDSGDDYRRKTDLLARNFAQTIGDGFKKYFYYDARHTTSPNFLLTYSLFEWDGSIRPKAVAYSILAQVFDGSEGKGKVSLASNVTAYKFDRAGTPLLIIWSNTFGAVKLLNSTLQSNSIRVYDAMGNSLPISSGVKFGTSPIYVETRGVTEDQLLNSLSVTNSIDTTSPAVSIVTFPIGPVSGREVSLRWYGGDDLTQSGKVIDTSSLTLKNETALTYSYMLEGYDSGWSSWVENTDVRYRNLANGLYTFKVRAKDDAGNISPTVSKYVGINVSTPNSFDTPYSSIPVGPDPFSPGTIIVTPPAPIIGDFNNDRLVNSLDFSLLVSAWNQNNATYDINHDGIVNSLDYVVMVKNWN